jgi:hypothetical protein
MNKTYRIITVLGALVAVVAALSQKIAPALHVTQDQLLVADVAFAIVLFVILVTHSRKGHPRHARTDD